MSKNQSGPINKLYGWKLKTQRQKKRKGNLVPTNFRTSHTQHFVLWTWFAHLAFSLPFLPNLQLHQTIVSHFTQKLKWENIYLLLSGNDVHNLLLLMMFTISNFAINSPDMKRWGRWVMNMSRNCTYQGDLRYLYRKYNHRLVFFPLFA